jgi:hypothetical protein
MIQMTGKDHDQPNAPLPQPVREHLGRELRAAYIQKQEKPAYLGDPALPLAFDEPLNRLASKERVARRRRAREEGIAAVETALEHSDDDPNAPPA